MPRRSLFVYARINAINTVELLNSTLVGTPTGGNVNGYGELKSFNLKNHPMQVWYSTKYFELIKDYQKDSLYPNVGIEHTFENFTNGIDAEVEWILKDN